MTFSGIENGKITMPKLENKPLFYLLALHPFPSG